MYIGEGFLLVFLKFLSFNNILGVSTNSLHTQLWIKSVIINSGCYEESLQNPQSHPGPISRPRIWAGSITVEVPLKYLSSMTV